jgi:hypothetical protein
MQIKIEAARDFGSDITVQSGYYEDGDFILEECNHAGAIEELVDYGGLQHDSVGDLDWFDDERLTLVCDKPNCDYQEIIESEEPDFDRED